MALSTTIIKKRKGKIVNILNELLSEFQTIGGLMLSSFEAALATCDGPTPYGC